MATPSPEAGGCGLSERPEPEVLRPVQALSEDVVALPALERQAQRIPIERTGRLDVSDDRRNTGDKLDIHRIFTSVRGSASPLKEAGQTDRRTGTDQPRLASCAARST